MMNKLQLSKFLGYSSMFILLLSGGGIPFLLYRKALFFVVLFLFAFLLFRQGINLRELRQIATILVLILAFLFLNYFFAVSEQSIQKVLANVTIMFSACLAAFYFKSQKNEGLFIKSLYFSLKVILFHSLINFLIFPIVDGHLSLIGNWHYECSSFAKMFFYNPQKYSFSVLGLTMVRNQGAFWEPGVLQIFLNILLFLNLFVVKSKRIIVMATIIAILTTLSTTGFLVMMILLAIYSFKLVSRNFLLLPIVVLFLLGLYSITSININDKVSGSGANSFQVRFFDLVQPMLIVFDNPLTGVGLDDQEYINIRSDIAYNLWLSNIDFDSLEKGSTNSITFFLATSGIPATILLIWMLYKQTFIKNKKRLFFLLMFFSLMTEPLLLKPFFFIFVISGGIYLLNKFRWKTY